MSHIQRGYRAGVRFGNSHLIKDISPYKLSRYGANLIRSGASIMTQAAQAATTIKGGQILPQSDTDTQIDIDRDINTDVLSPLGFDPDLPEKRAKKKKPKPKKKQNITKQSKPKQTTKQNKTKTNNKTKPNKTKVSQKQKAISIKRPVKSVKFQPQNIFD